MLRCGFRYVWRLMMLTPSTSTRFLARTVWVHAALATVLAREHDHLVVLPYG